ncbi:NLRC3 [Symbiodinium sp. CCMP2592]|nr:NLRC3 [Symbiodinium sp. CCMP2592]
MGFCCRAASSGLGACQAKYNLEDPRQLAAFLKYADIRLVRTKYLYELRSQSKLLPRRQEADEWGLVSHEEVSEWAAGTRDAMMISISHAWETREHPDPCGDQLSRLVDCLSLYEAAYYSEIWVFYDYVSLFQFERRTSAEEESFRRSMSHMHVLYAHDCNWTFRLEALTPDDVWDAALQNSEHLVMVYDVESGSVQGRPLGELVPNRVHYRGRGWCKAEVEWSSCRSRSDQNQCIDAGQSKRGVESAKARAARVSRAPLQGKVPMAPEVFEEDMKNAAFTHRDDAAEVQKLQWEIFHQKVSECEEALLANLPKGEVSQLARALKHYEKLKVLRLRNIEVGDEEGEEFAQALGLNRTITELKLKIIESSGAQCGALWNEPMTDMEILIKKSYQRGPALANALKANESITTVNLEGDVMGAEGCEALADALTINRTIANIGLAYNYFEDEGCKAIAGALKTNRSIARIDLNWNRIGPRGSQALADALMVNRAITSINLRSNNIGDEGCEALADALKTNTTIRSINLEMNGIGAQGGKAVAEALKSNDSIANIQLERNSIEEELRKEIEEALKIRRAATHSTESERDRVDATKIYAWTGKVRIKGLASQLKTNSSITTLNLRIGNIAGEDWEAVAGALKINRGITAVDLVGSYIGDEGWKALANALRVNRIITSIFVDRSVVGDESCKELAEALKTNTAITSIGLGHTHIGPQGGKALADALMVNRTITSINLRSNNIGAEGCKALADALKINHTIESINVGENGVSELELASFPYSVRRRLEGLTPGPWLLSPLCLQPCLWLLHSAAALSCLPAATSTPPQQRN